MCHIVRLMYLEILTTVGQNWNSENEYTRKSLLSKTIASFSLLFKGFCKPYSFTGTYGATTGLANYTDCSDCTIGKYCETTGLTTPTGDCAAGYYCVQGMHRKKNTFTNGPTCNLWQHHKISA